MALVNILHNTVRSFRFKAGNGKFNSGISKRLGIVKENHPDIENVEVTEDTLDSIESGITVPNKRVEKNHRVAEFKKIERKFFKKEAYPNLLTWSEKEQIRFLYNSDPTTWSPDKLSECFPATADIIKKLVKSQWKPMASERILRHDTNVNENWKAVETGQLNLPEPLLNHIKSFISRGKTLNVPVPEKSLQTYNSYSSPTSSEFIEIIQNFKNKSSPPNSSNINQCSADKNINQTQRGETYVLNRKDTVPLKHKYYTLHHLKKELSNSISNSGGIELKQNDNLVESQPKIDSELLPKPVNILTPRVHKKSDAKIAVNSEYIDEVPMKIMIPKEKKVNSKTHVYKVNDCYYDSNGDFIYKVPGMI